MAFSSTDMGMDMDTSAPPSYHDTLSFAPDSRTHAQRFTDQISGTRSRHIYSIITTQVLPVIQSRAEAGLNRTIITLLPAGAATATTSEEDSKPLNISLTTSNDFDDGLTNHEVYLTSPTDSIAFWSQKSVVDELRLMLEKSLSISTPGLSSSNSRSEKERPSPLDARSKESLPTNPPPPPHLQLQPQIESRATTTTAPAAARSKGFFSRRLSSRNAPATPTPPPPPPPPTPLSTKGGYDIPDRRHDPPETFVSVSSEEVLVRTQTPFGLYETSSRTAVVVRVKIQE